MEEYKVSDYSIYTDAMNTTAKFNEKITTIQSSVNDGITKLSDESVFMGPIQESCIAASKVMNTKLDSVVTKFGEISNYLQEVATAYVNGDTEAMTKLLSTGDGEKSIDTSYLISGSNVSNAATKYASELEKAEYATLNQNLFTTTTTEMINGQPVKVTHIVINDASQINGAPANGKYANGLEKSSDAAKRLNSSILVNGSHFSYSDGSEDLKGNNHIVIVDGQIMHDGVSGGQELLLDNKGNIYNAYGKSAQQLVDDGVKYSFACHSTQVIENGDISPSYREGRQYKRTVIGQSAPGEYYIVTDTTYNNKLSDTAQYLKNKGCTNAYSLDQGGSVSLVKDDKIINNPSGENGERAVGDFLYFTV